MKLAIFGDSFATRMPNSHNIGWPILLERNYTVTNFAQAGSSEYKILKSIQSADLDSYDQIIISHTSPNRVYVPHNPLHQHSQYHKNCDIIFSDVEHNHDEFSQACQLFFKHIFDLDHAKHIHELICKEIDQLTNQRKVLHLTHFDYSGLYQFPNLVDFYTTWSQHRGSTNHYNQQGNTLVYESIMNTL